MQTSPQKKTTPRGKNINYDVFTQMFTEDTAAECFHLNACYLQWNFARKAAGKVVTAIFGVKMKMRVVVNWSFFAASRVFSEGFPFANGKKSSSQAIKNENSHLNWMQTKVEVWGTVILGRRFQKLINSHWSLMEKCAGTIFALSRSL